MEKTMEKTMEGKYAKKKSPQAESGERTDGQTSPVRMTDGAWPQRRTGCRNEPAGRSAGQTQ
ncbi:MAG: hypothetical protein DBY36_04140 [Clostridiales bacterium]|nr:MAG: hypothetical protein DBY36_04140 [Clostridiales bacterium]